MVSLAIPPLASLKWPSSFELSDKIPANLEALITLYHQFSAVFRFDSSASLISFIIYAAVTFLAITLRACVFLHSNRKNKIIKSIAPAFNSDAEVNEGSQEKFAVGPIDGDDAAYAEEIQLQETLLASLCTSEIANSPSSSIQCPSSNKDPVNFEKEPVNTPLSFCDICLENKENWQMFSNDICSHSFCYECTASHIVTKIQDRVKDVACPSLNCKALLNIDVCRLMIPDGTLVQWDELFCMSLIPESQKLYCPFLDCSTMLVNESEGVISEIKCVVCKRSFCGECRVPWHSEFTCKEFQKLHSKKKGKEDEIVKILAKKKSWKKCPKCKMYIEKSEGCSHITCRCRYEFCYRCGGKWSDTHGTCRPKS